jgi:hypothetical protein
MFVLTFTLIALMAACGSQTNTSSDETISDQTADEVQAAAQPATVSQAEPEADTKVSVDALIGEWIDITDAANTAKITKIDNGYQFADKDGKYPTTFENGKLKVKVNDTDTAEAYINSESGHLFVVLGEDMWEYSKK